MSNTHLSLRIHLVWATKNRRPWLDPEWRSRMFACMDTIVTRKAGRLLCAGGVRDHVHLYVEAPATITIADLVGGIKSSTARWIHQSFPHRRDFKWQHGYGAFTVSGPEDSALREYIRNQEQHHRERAYAGEYLSLLEILFQQLPPQLRHPPANRSVQNPVAHPDDRTAEDLRLHQIRGDYLLVQLATEIFLDRFPQLLVRLPGQGHRGAHPVHLVIHQSQILRRHFPQNPLSPALHQRLEPEHEIAGCILECSAEEPRLHTLRDTRRHEHRLDPRDRIHRGGYRVDQVGITLGLCAPARDIEQDFRVIAGDRLVTHR